MALVESEALHDTGIPVWRRERRARLALPGPFYRSGYLNAFLCGRLEDGRELAVVAGTHSRFFPYRDPKSRFDDLLLIVGTDAYRVSGRRISSLGVTLGPRDSASVSYNGRAHTASGATVQIDFNFNLFARIYAARPQGLGVGRLLLGLSWQPALAVGTGSLTIHDDRYRITNVTGIVERGSLKNVRGRLFQFGYEYQAWAVPDGAPAAHVRFRTYALHEGARGIVIRTLLRIRPARESLTLAGERPVDGDAASLAPRADAKVLLSIRHDINLGPATIRRELVRIADGDRTRYGFRERIDPT